MSNHNDPSPAPGRFRRRVVIYVALACAVCATFVWIAPKGPMPVPQNEASPRSLLLREGRWYRQGGVEPFTGILADYYPNGTRKSRSVVSNGFLEGISEGWHTNGQKQLTEFFHAGASHGLRTKWYPSGQKLSESTVVHGKLEGIFSRYYEDGQLAESITLKDGLPDGPSCSYYPSGCLKAEAQLTAGKVIAQKFWNDHEHTSPTSPASPPKLSMKAGPPATAPGGGGGRGPG